MSQSNASPISAGPVPRWRDYLLAVLAAGFALLLRGALDPLMSGTGEFFLSLLAVIVVAWGGGFGPAVVATLVGSLGLKYFFLEPRNSFAVSQLGDLLAIGLFVLGGAGCGLLGQAQRWASQGATHALRLSLDRQAELEQEIERRREAERRTAEALAQLDTFLLNAPLGIAFYDQDLRCVRVNRYLAEANGVPINDYVGKTPREATPDFPEELLADFRQVIATAEPILDRPVVGRWEAWEFSLYPVCRAGEVIGLGMLARDVTARHEADRLGREREDLRHEVAERRRAEETAEAASVELRRSNSELEKFAYVASHDLQEPLRKIQAFGDRLRARCRDQLAEQGRDYLDRMLASAGRMRRLIDDLLAFSRVTTRPQALAEVDLDAVAADVVSDLETRIEQAEGDVTVGPLPTIEADRSQMRQLLQNLIGNALKFRRPDVPPVVRVRAAPEEDGRLRLEVQDNGIGFDEKYLDRVFEVFQRLHGRDEYEGTGVGLAICRKIVERHGGSITATSHPDTGSTFIVVLPVRQSKREPGCPTESDPSPSSWPTMTPKTAN